MDNEIINFEELTGENLLAALLKNYRQQKQKKLTKTIATINFKGGVGKTTITWCLGDYISTYRDEHVILFDLDAQMSLTQAISLNEDGGVTDHFSQWWNRSLAKKKTIFHAILEYIKGEGFNFEIDDNFIYKISKEYHFVPSIESLYWLEVDFDRKRIQGFIKDLLGKITVTKQYDYALFDCPPSFTALSYSVLSCCDLILVPVNPDFYAVRGVSLMVKVLQALRKKINASPMSKIAVFMNKAKSYASGMTKETSFYWNEVTKICNKLSNGTSVIRCFDAPIYDRVGIKRAIIDRNGLPINFFYDFKILWANIKEFINE